MKYFLSLLIYRTLLFVLLPFLLLFLLIRSKNHPEYRQRLSERLGIIPKNLQSNGIVIHAASVGEVIALKSFIDKVLSIFTHLPITVTTFTPTGSEQVKKLFGDRVQHCYLPLDLFWCSALFLKKLKPKAMIFMETELWPNIIAQLADTECKLMLINGRLSEKSTKSYQKLLWLIKPTLNRFNKILTQSSENQTNFIALGADENRCQLSGNLKFDISINQNIIDKEKELKQLVPTNRPIWILASSHQGDETLALQVFIQLQQEFPELLLVIAPRHPERFEQIAKLCIEHDLNTLKRSENATISAEHQVWLLDSLGELMAAYSLSDIVTMGGSFSNIGGHNPLEPALFKKPIIVGTDMKNFTEIQQQLEQVNGIEQLTVNNVEQLTKKVKSLLLDQTQQKLLGENAYRVVQSNQGASERTLQQLIKLLEV
ncbi:MAG: lipid IV(A) 3-deoxy-D-manno-octulosonic acid transferase [Alteromonadaceae bacterium]|nr:lipid IV(A) 3-deoxy-D-manno-octulosonic acid transferase [Alteromonadaceae bacterium]